MTRRIMVGVLLGAACLLTACSPSPPATPAAAVVPQQAEADLVKITPSADYPLKVCLVSNEKLDHDRLAFRYKGREVQFCCTHCIEDFRKNPAAYMAKLDQPH